MKKHIVSVIVCLTLAATLVVRPAAGSADTAPGAAPEAIPFLPAGHFETPFILPQGAMVVSHTGILWSYTSSQSGPTSLSGTYRSPDGGYMWELVSHLEKSNVYDIVPSPAGSGEDVLFWAVSEWYTGSDPLRMSTPDGRTWRLPQQPPDGIVTHIALSPSYAVDRTLYAAGSSNGDARLWHSTDAGDHWVAVNSPGRSLVQNLVLSPYLAADQTLFVSLSDNTIWCSADGGSTWQPADSGLGAGSANPIEDVAIGDMSQGDMVLFAALGKTLKISLNRGQSWTVRGSQLIRSLFVAPDFATSRTLYGVEPEYRTLLRSTDLGQTWEAVPGFFWVSGMAFSPSYTLDHTIYVGDSSAIWVSHDSGATWASAPARPILPWTSLGRTIKLVASPNQDQDGLILAADPSPDTRDGAFRSVDGGRTWQKIQLPASSGRLSLAISPSFAQDHAILVAIDTVLFKTTDGGDHWQQLGDHLPTYYAPAVVVSPGYAQDHTLFAYEYYAGAFRSEDDGETWTAIPGTQYVTDLDVSPGYPGDPTLFVCRYNDGIFRSDDGGATWTSIQNKPGAPAWNVALSPAFVQDGVVLAAVTGSSLGGLFRSDDRGDTWTDVTGEGMDAWTDYLSISPRFAQDQTVMVGIEDVGAYLSDDGGQTWYRLPGAPGTGGAGAKADGLITYEQQRPLPLTTASDAVYRYWWPDFTISPARIQVCLESGETDPVHIPLHLELSDAAAVAWTAGPQTDWLSTAPSAGTLPATLTLTLIPGLAPVGTWTDLNITVNWSPHTPTTYAVPVLVANDCHYVWLPYISLAFAAQGHSMDKIPGRTD
jgi:photosystem II stability/assembly factor-like uncharacterized protein